jgi:AraC family transcriptional regulator
MTNRTYDCVSDTVWVEPAGERHQNRFDEVGASVVVLQPDSEREELLRPCAALLNEASSFQHAGITGLARTLVREMQLSDTLTPLALEATGLEMLVMGSRARKDHRRSCQPPGWLLRVEEIVRDRFREPLRVSQIAREVGVHPVHLGRVFRQHKHVPIASYVRGLRLEWAAGQLQTTEDSLSAIALKSGFSDQSHFTRVFRQALGIPPARFRRLARVG